MRTKEMALSYLKRANSRLIDARSALKRGDIPDVIRYSQEAVEMSLKAVLRAVGIEYPKDHDVSDVLLACKERLPEEILEDMERLMRISSELVDKRGPAMYGDEEAGIPAEELFEKDDAEKALKDANYVFEKCKSAITSFFGGIINSNLSLQPT